MAMGIVSDDEFDSELNKIVPNREKSNPVSPTTSNQAEIKDVTRGRPPHSIEVPNTLRRVIGDDSVTNGRESALELAKAFGVSPSSVSAYAAGSNSTSSYDEKPNEDVIRSARERISKKARAKLMQSLNKITSEKLDGARARDLAGIAKDMSAVVKNMETDNNTNQGKGPSGPTFIFYSPQQRKEEAFEVINVKDG